MIKCMVIDDEPLALELVKSYISKMPQLQLVGSYTDAIDASESIRKQHPDLLFLDIQMPDITGIQLYRSLENKPMVIFTTAYSEYAVEGFELDAVDYLLKPFSFERFEKAVARAQEYNAYKNATPIADPECFFVKSDYQLMKINCAEVLFIEGLDDYVKIHLHKAKPILSLISLKSLIEKLPQTKFKRVHRSFIIPLQNIRSIRNKKIMLADNTEIPIGASYADELTEWMKK